MDDDDELEVSVYEVGEPPSYPWDNGLVIAEAMNFMAAQSALIADYMNRLATRASANANFGVDQADFAAEAAKAIETISEGSDDA